MVILSFQAFGLVRLACVRIRLPCRALPSRGTKRRLGHASRVLTFKIRLLSQAKPITAAKQFFKPRGEQRPQLSDLNISRQAFIPAAAAQIVNGPYRDAPCKPLDRQLNQALPKLQTR